MPASCGGGLKDGFQKRPLTPQAFHPHRRRVAAAKPRLAAYPAAPPTAPKAAALPAAARAGAKRAKRGKTPSFGTVSTSSASRHPGMVGSAPVSVTFIEGRGR